MYAVTSTVHGQTHSEFVLYLLCVVKEIARLLFAKYKNKEDKLGKDEFNAFAKDVSEEHRLYLMDGALQIEAQASRPSSVAPARL